jgi:hypothetical protein
MEYQDYLEIPSNRASALKKDNRRAHREIEKEPLSSQDKPYQDSSKVGDKTGAVPVPAYRVIKARWARHASTQDFFARAMPLPRAFDDHRNIAGRTDEVTNASCQFRLVGAAGLRPGRFVAFCPTVG